MALSDRIALLRAGELEQVSTPREIYNCPASAYTAQFIGQTNLLRGRVEQGWTRCGLLAWRCRGVVDGPATFSLRPESVRLHPDGRSGAPDGLAEVGLSRPPNDTKPGSDDTVRFRATIRHQIFGGATDLLGIACADGTTLLARIPSRGGLEGEHEFEFSAVDAVRVRDEA